MSSRIKKLALGLTVLVLVLGVAGALRSVLHDGGQSAYATAQSEQAGELAPPVEAAELDALVAGNTQFALDLYHALTCQPGNLFFSPYSISTALAMAYAGARGETERQMAEALRFALSQDDLHPAFDALRLDLTSAVQSVEGLELAIANALWGQTGHPFLTEFLDLLETFYNAPLRSADFAGAPEKARTDINAWVDEMTAGRIAELMGPGSIMPDTRLILANAIYFLGTWKSQFNEEMTWERTFHLLDGSEISVPTMYAEDTFDYAERSGYQVAELHYTGDEISMVILLPSPGTFEAFEADLEAAELSRILDQIGRWKVHLSMPRFELNSEFSLVSVLTALGMPDAFSVDADFSGMDGGRDLFIDDVIHQAFVSVSEEGTEAAAATAVMMRSAVRRFPYYTMRIDRPFIFLIRNRETGTILFMGRVLDPRAG